MGQQSGSTPPEPAWVYTVHRTRAGLFLRVAARWPTRRLCHFLLNPHPLLRMPRTLGVPMSSARTRDKPSCVPRSPRRRWCLLSAPPPWFPAQRVGSASIAESAQARRGEAESPVGRAGADPLRRRGSPTQAQKRLGECRLAGSGALGREWDRSGFFFKFL